MIRIFFFHPHNFFKFQCLKRLPEESRADETLIPVISLWRHEMHRIIRDQLSRTSDLIWFDTTIQEIIEQVNHYMYQYTRETISTKYAIQEGCPIEFHTTNSGGENLIKVMSQNHEKIIFLLMKEREMKNACY